MWKRSKGEKIRMIQNPPFSGGFCIDQKVQYHFFIMYFLRPFTSTSHTRLHFGCCCFMWSINSCFLWKRDFSWGLACVWNLIRATRFLSARLESSRRFGLFFCIISRKWSFRHFLTFFHYYYATAGWIDLAVPPWQRYVTILQEHLPSLYATPNPFLYLRLKW